MPTEQEKSQQVLNHLMEMDANSRSNLIMNTTVKDTIKKIVESVDEPDLKLNVGKVWIDKKHDNDNISAQKEIRNKGQVWGDDVRGNLELVDKLTGNVIDKVDGIKLAVIPKLTDRGTFLIRGNEYQFSKQSRLKPGVYTKAQTNGEISSFFNVDKTVDFDRGFNNNFKLNFDPESKIFTMGYGSKNVPLINALKTIGVDKDQLEKAWGTDVYKANAKAYDHHEVRDQHKLYSAIFGKTPEAGSSNEAINTEIKNRLFETKLDPDTTKITLGKSFNNVDKDAIMLASKKIIDIHKGDVEGDDRESLIFKSIYDVEDHVREKLVKNADKIKNSIRLKLRKNRSINQSISSQSFDPFVAGTITTSQLSSPPSQTNIMSIIGEGSKMTVVGEGGIGSANAITNDVRKISNSEAGFIDPLHTPEGSNIGVAVHTSMDTVKVGNDLWSKFLLPSGKKQLMRPIDVWDKNVAFPDQYKNVDGKMVAKDSMVKVTKLGKLTEVKAKDVDAIIGSATGMFDTSVNSIPFLDSIQGNRGLTASKMQEQALSLKHRDRPLFNIIDEKGLSVGGTLGGLFASPKSKVDGVVSSIGADSITVKDKNGKEHTSNLYNNFSLNSESYLHNESTVAVGDKVKAGGLLADNNFTKDGHVALGANLRVAYVPLHGYNFEDSTIVSESAAKKLTSQHMYDFKSKRSSAGVFSKEKFKAYYPEEVNASILKKLDKDGIIKPGETVEYGDVLISHMEKRSPTADDIALGRLDKQLKRDMGNNSLKWEKGNIGIVTDVQKHGNSVLVSVKTEEQLKVADKISGLHGNKHIVSKIVPDSEMPFSKETGQHVEITMSPIGVSNRINTSQLLEAAAGKIAQKTGKTYDIMNFTDSDNTRRVLGDLEKAGISDTEILIDPTTGKEILNPIKTGVSHILKLEHTVDHKFSARYREGYDANEQPLSGGHTGSKNLGRMEASALLARGANENLKEMYTIKGQRNDEYWKALETGQTLPPPQKSFVWGKMQAMMNGAGINIEQNGKSFALKPMTDKDILAVSSGELKKPTDTYRKKDLSPMKEGLFDPFKAGGMNGDKFTHFALPEKILNPITAYAAATLVDMPSATLEGIMTGEHFVDKISGKIVKPGTPGAESGGAAIENLLKRINVDEQLKFAKETAANSNKKPVIDKMHKKIKYLTALQNNNMKPTDYMISNVLVTPSKYRPMFSMGTEGTVIVSDINDLYQQAGHTSNALKELKSTLDTVLDDDDVKNVQLAEARGAIYKDVKAIAGLQDPTSYLHRVKNKKGFITQISGGKDKQSKEGFYQDKVVTRKQDLVGRSTLTLNPDLGGDEVGIPKDMATKIFQPHIMSKLVGWGYSPIEAQKQIKDETSAFQKARDIVSSDRLVIINRAPSLHRWNMIAFKPKLTDGKSVEMPPIALVRNLSADIDGDTVQVHSPISVKAQKEAEGMLPSSSMIKSGYDTVLNTPSMDTVVGSWLVSKGKGGTDTKLKFNSMADAREAFRGNKFNYADSVVVDGHKASFGMHEINADLPDNAKNFDIELNSKNIDGWINKVTKSHNGKTALALADKIKVVGNSYTTAYGLTLGLNDTASVKSIQDEVISQGKLNTQHSGNIVKSYADSNSKGQKNLENHYGEDSMLGIIMKSGGGKGIGNTASITLMPGVVADADDNAIPIPVTKSYSEGLDTFGYWTAAHGARGGNIKKSVSSFKPGWLTKDLISSVYNTRIYGDTPVDTEGLEYDVSDKKGVMNRYLAQDVKDTGGKIIAKRNDIVDSDMVNKMNQHKIKSLFVQSPLTDPTPGDGFSSYSYGVDYMGNRQKRGDNIGIMSSHTITEPSLNMAMKSFHTGGTVGSGKSKGTVFDALDRTLRFNRNIPDKATLASLDGTVVGINKSSIGGHDVILSDGKNEEVRYVSPDRALAVQVGDNVFKGGLLSDGTPTSHDVLKYKGMKETQKFLVNELSGLTSGLDKRDIETVVRGITNTTRVMHPGSSNWVSGDIAPLTSVEAYNKNNSQELDLEHALGNHLAQSYGRHKEGSKIDNNIVDDLSSKGVKRVLSYKDRIKHEPFLMPTGIQMKAASSEDWISRLAHSRLTDVLREGTTQSWKSEVSDQSNPMTSFITGVY